MHLISSSAIIILDYQRPWKFAVATFEIQKKFYLE